MEVKNYHSYKGHNLPSPRYLQNLKAVNASTLDSAGMLIHRRSSVDAPTIGTLGGKMEQLHEPPAGFRQFNRKVVIPKPFVKGRIKRARHNSIDFVPPADE